MPQQQRQWGAHKPSRDTLDPSRVRTHTLKRRRSKVHSDALATVPHAGMKLTEFLNGLPDILAARDLRAVAAAIADRHRAGKRVILGMGAHPIKVGLSPVIIDLMRRGILSAVAVNGAAIIHDFELAYHGETSEDVATGLRDGHFGMARETADFLNRAVAECADKGLGAAVGEAIVNACLPNAHLSILAAGVLHAVPVTVHVTIGADIIHMHPSADGAALGTASLFDFRRLAGIIQHLRGGVFINLGSAVVIPEVFLKALNLARNVGNRVDNLVTVDMDFVRHYRPLVNVVQRPTAAGGRGYQLVGHHEIMFPLLCAAVLEKLGGTMGHEPRRRARLNPSRKSQKQQGNK